MEILNVEGINFPIAKYDICRFYHYGENYKDSFYCPADMKFFKYDDYMNENLEFEGKRITQQFWAGVTEWTEEKEKLTSNLHFDICGETDDFPVINSWSVDVHNLMNKYLIWELKDIGIIDELPAIDKIEPFKEPVYIIKKSKSEKEEDLITMTFAMMAREGKEFSKEDVENLENKLYEPFQYIKVHGVTRHGSGYDATIVTVNSGMSGVDIKVNRLEREEVEFKSLMMYDRHYKVCNCSEEEFNKVFDKVLDNIK